MQCCWTFFFSIVFFSMSLNYSWTSLSFEKIQLQIPLDHVPISPSQFREFCSLKFPQTTMVKEKHDFSVCLAALLHKLWGFQSLGVLPPPRLTSSSVLGHSYRKCRVGKGSNGFRENASPQERFSKANFLPRILSVASDCHQSVKIQASAVR